MILAEQIKELGTRREVLERCLDIEQKRIDLRNEEEKTQEPSFWDDPAAAREQLRKVASIKAWVDDYETVGKEVEDLALMPDFLKEGVVSEAELDELAWELDVDWYDSTGMSLEEKRETLKLAQQIKRKRGTKWAVERLISAYFGEGYVMEWYEMYGTPYTFVALTTNTHTDAHNFEKFVEAVKAAKNARSHLAGVFYFWQQGPDPGIEYALDTKLHRYEFVKCGTRPRIATVGFIVKPSIELDPEARLLFYGFTHAGTITCGTYPRPGTLGRVLQNPIGSNLEAKFTGYGYEKAGSHTCGTYPRRLALGVVLAGNAATAARLLCGAYSFVKCGTKGAGTKGAAITNKAATAASLACAAYSFVKCGTRRCGE